MTNGADLRSKRSHIEAPRRSVAAVAAAAAAVALVILGSAANAADARPIGHAATIPTSVSVRSATTTQYQLQVHKVLKLRLTSTDKGVTGVFADDGTNRKLTANKGMVFGSATTKTMNLTLTPAGRARAARCETGPQRWRVVTRSGNWTVVRWIQLKQDPYACLPPTPGATCRGGDPLDRYRCLLPFPNDLWTRPDPTTPTGLRLNLPSGLMPVNSRGQRISTTDYNRNDGFSGNSAILTRIPGLDSPEALAATGAPTIRNIGRSLEADSPIVLLDATTGTRTPIWSEVDMSIDNPGQRLLLTHGAKVLTEGHRYIIALRNLKRADGTPIPANHLFTWYRDNSVPGSAPDFVQERKAHMEDLLTTLGNAGIERGSLHMAWDFTVASAESVAGPALAMRDDAFAKLGDTNLADGVISGGTPQAKITAVQNYTLAESRYVLRRVDGTIRVPCYMGHVKFDGSEVGPCQPGTVLNRGADGAPQQATDAGGTAAFYDAKFTCIVPRASEGSNAMGSNRRAVLFGHGLLGTGADVTAIKGRAGLDKALACGADWIGLSREDISNAVGALIDLDRFPAVADRSVQGLINFLYLGRWMVSQAPGGLNDTPEFKPESGVVVDPAQKLYYLGGSQGGIMGTAVTALSPDFERSMLAVPAVGYSTLLTRSAAFQIFGPPVQIGYPDAPTRQILLSLVQTLWDKGEGGGYVHHITDDPLPNTPPHKVLLEEAFGDHLVANIQTETMARTIGATLRTPALDPGRSPDEVPFFGIPTGSPELFNGAGFDSPASLVLIDIGPLRGTAPNFRGVTPAPPFNVPPTEATKTEGNNGVDPHADVATSETSVKLLFEFLKPNGSLLTEFACGSSPCYAEGWTGPN